MQPISPQQLEAKVDSRYRTFVILWLGMFISIMLFLALALAIRSKSTPNPMFSYSLLGIALTIVAVSLLLKQRMVKKAIDNNSIEALQSAQIISIALCEAGALFGLLDHLLTGSNTSWFALASGGIGLLLHFPNKNHVRAVSFKPPMI